MGRPHLFKAALKTVGIIHADRETLKRLKGLAK